VHTVIEVWRCGAGCPDGWEARLVRAIVSAPPPPRAEEVCAVPRGSDWRGWAVERLLDAPDLTPDVLIDRAVRLGRAGLGTTEGHLEARLAGGGEAELVLATRILERLPSAAESLRFRAAMVLVANGRGARARPWLNQIATSGRTAFRAFARAELERLP